MSLDESLLEQERTRSFSANQKEKLNKLRSDAWRGEWEEVYKTYEQEREFRTKGVTRKGDTVLHMAVWHGETHVVEHLVGLLEHDVEQGRHADEVLGAENDDKNTPLHLAAMIGNVEMCDTICRSYRDASLIKKQNANGETPLFLAVRYGMKEAFICLHRRYVENPGGPSDNFATIASDNNDDTILHCAIEEGHFEVAIEIVHLCKDHMKEMMKCNKEGLTPLHFLADQPSAFTSWGLGLPNFIRPCDGRLPQMRKMETIKWSRDIMNQLLDYAPDEDMDISETVSGSKIDDTPLMIAAKNGVIEMVKEILRRFPLAIDTENKEGKNIVLLAAEKGQTKVYQFLWENEKLNKKIFRHEDNDGNNALHLAAKFGVNQNWQTITTVEEYKWFQFVKNSLPSELWVKRNNDGETAEAIFRDSYKEQMESDRKWLNQTSQACSVTSTLIASMAFTNIAGGNFDIKTNLLSSLVLSTSLSSTICFLAILAFRSQYHRFSIIVAPVLLFGILYLFISIAALWITLMPHAKGKSLAIYAIAVSPIALLIFWFLPIFIRPMLKSTFSKLPPPNRNTTSAIHSRRSQKKENGPDLIQGS